MPEPDGWFHDGPLPQRDGYLQIASDHVRVTALKRSEDGDDLIVRCAEGAGRGGRVTVTVPVIGLELSADFGPWEIKTFRVSGTGGGAPTVRETDFLE